MVSNCCVLKCDEKKVKKIKENFRRDLRVKQKAVVDKAGAPLYNFIVLNRTINENRRRVCTFGISTKLLPAIMSGSCRRCAKNIRSGKWNMIF